jgi:hypothetical protein
VAAAAAVQVAEHPARPQSYGARKRPLFQKNR